MQLVRQVLAGDTFATEKFLNRMGCVVRFLFAADSSHRVLRGSDELAHDTVARIWENLSSFEGRSTLESWAYSFCTYSLLSASRKRRCEHDQELDAQWAEDCEEPLLEEDRQHIRAAIGALDKDLAEVVMLRYYSDFTFPKMSCYLGIPESTAKARLYRAMAQLAAGLQSGFGSLRNSNSGESVDSNAARLGAPRA